MVEATFLVPFVAGLIAFFTPSRVGRVLLVLTGLVVLWVPRSIAGVSLIVGAGALLLLTGLVFACLVTGALVL